MGKLMPNRPAAGKSAASNPIGTPPLPESARPAIRAAGALAEATWDLQQGVPTRILSAAPFFRCDGWSGQPALR